MTRNLTDVADLAVLRASYERTLDVLEQLVRSYRELEHDYATPQQAAALRAAHALLVEAGRRAR